MLVLKVCQQTQGYSPTRVVGVRAAVGVRAETGVEGYCRNNECSKLRTETYDGVALRVGFGSMNRMILVLRFTDASSSSGPFMLRFLGRNGGGA